jgi:hypothetical protein
MIFPLGLETGALSNRTARVVETIDADANDPKSVSWRSDRG